MCLCRRHYRPPQKCSVMYYVNAKFTFLRTNNSETFFNNCPAGWRGASSAGGGSALGCLIVTACSRIRVESLRGSLFLGEPDGWVSLWQFGWSKFWWPRVHCIGTLYEYGFLEAAPFSFYVPSLLLLFTISYANRYAVAQLVEALRYKSEGRGCLWTFSLT